MKRVVMKLSCVSVGCVAVSLSWAARAEQMFISDKLVVNVYTEANQDSNKIATLDSGDALESLEKSEGYTKVKLSDGREGWVKSSYLVSQPPAIVRLRELEKDYGTSNAAQSAEEIKRLKEHAASLEAQVATLQANRATPTPTSSDASVVQTVPSLPVGKLEGEAIATTTSIAMGTHLAWSAALVAVGAALGFAGGYQTLARRIRRKYGNVRIY